jgi:hypothetical protein
VSWQAASFVVLSLGLVAGCAWYERDRPPARTLALVATLAALAVVGRLAFAAIPNVKPTTDIVLFAGYALGAVPGFAVGAVSAVVSNVFLSQGPWTPWQMAGWGGVGIAGALLARVLRGREPGRLELALACGAAGLAFGAWMDLYQLSLAAHQDLDGYLALAASSLPYNIAHAVGNVVFCLLIGPLFIRALRRYRRRLEVSWHAPATGAAATLLVVLALPAGADAASPADRAERFLLRAQNEDGGFGAAPGQRSSELFSGWSGLGLAAAGRNPRDVHRRGGRSLAGYLARRASSLGDVGEIERTMLVLKAAGLSPRRFRGRDLAAAVERRRRPNGSIANYVSYTAFGMLALRAAGVPAGRSTVSWLASARNPDGGYGLTPASVSDSDMTGAALQALAVVGRARGAAALGAVRWLRASQNGDGGYGQMEGRASNAQSTSYAIGGLLAARAGGATLSRARAYLRRLQRDDGSIAYSSSSSQTPVWVTAQALLALEGRTLPLATVPRRRPEPRPRSSAVADDDRRSGAAAGPADGGEGPSEGSDRPGQLDRTEAGGSAGRPARGPEGGAAPAPAGGGLRVERVRGGAQSDAGGGPGGWLVVLALVPAAALLYLLRRRPVAARLRRKLPRRRSA